MGPHRIAHMQYTTPDGAYIIPRSTRTISRCRNNCLTSLAAYQSQENQVAGLFHPTALAIRARSNGILEKRAV